MKFDENFQLGTKIQSIYNHIVYTVYKKIGTTYYASPGDIQDGLNVVFFIDINYSDWSVVESDPMVKLLKFRKEWGMLPNPIFK